jgi:hypothetical protein
LDVDTWYGRCQHTFDDVTRMLKDISKSIDTYSMKPTYRLSDADDCCVRLLEHGLVVQRFVKRQEEKSIEYLPMKSGLEIDMNRLRQGSYMLHELVAYTVSYLGEYQGQPVTLGTGPYGHYVQVGKERDKERDKERGNQKPTNKNCIVIPPPDSSMESSDKPIHKSLKDYTKKPISEFTLTDAIELLEDKNTVVEDSTKIMRQLNDTMSIRRGKFGCYVYYRPTPTATPQFISLKKFPGAFLDVDIETVVKWTIEQCPRQASKPVSKSKYVSCKKKT